MRGFMAETLAGALEEIYAVSRGTKCRQYMFAVSLSPPPDAQVTVADFEKTLTRMEEKLGLQDQPRVVVFHEKKGRRQSQQLRCDLNGVSFHHTGIYTGLRLNVHQNDCLIMPE